MGLCACVKEREMERETHLLQTGGVELRLIDDLYSHLGAKKERVSLLLHFAVTPVITRRPDIGAALATSQVQTHCCVAERPARQKKKGTTLAQMADKGEINGRAITG